MSPNAQPRFHAALDAGIAAGLLPTDAALTPVNDRPWPVVLLTALGAWFAAVPLLIAVGMLLGDIVRAGIGPYVVGALVLGAAVVVMRSKGLPLFVEQLAVPALLVGGGTLAMGLYRDFHSAGGAAIMGVVVLALATALPQNWLRVLLGAVAAGLLAQAVLPNWHGLPQASVLLVLHGLLAVWLLALWLQERLVAAAALLESLAAGWLLTTLLGLVWMAGNTFLVGGVVGANEVSDVLGWIAGFERHSWQATALQTGASVLVLTAAGVGALAWPSLRQTLPLAVAGVLALLAWFMPLLGAVLLALMVTATTQRWRLASACALAASWIVGAFYYQLHWPLADKALLLAGAGIVLGALAWLGHRSVAPSATFEATASPRSARLNWQGMVLFGGTLATVLVANGAIWQKQDLIARGKPVFMALMPVDPRSLMQGDFMRLRFATLDTQQLPLLQNMGAKRPRMVLQLDARGVATVQRVHTPGQPLAPHEMLLELSPKDGNWVVVTDAWYFKEGQAQIWQAARYGEFRVLPDGRALLVGMADAALQPITPKPVVSGSN